MLYSHGNAAGASRRLLQRSRACAIDRRADAVCAAWHRVPEPADLGSNFRPYRRIGHGLHRLRLAGRFDDRIASDSERGWAFHGRSRFRTRIFGNHPGLRAGPARNVSGFGSVVAHTDAASVQRRRDGCGRLACRIALRSLRVLRTGICGWNRSKPSQFAPGRCTCRSPAPARRPALVQRRDGLTSQTLTNMPNATIAGPIACHEPAAATADVAAQAMDEKASAKVAIREDVCRRRKWLRRACMRKQSWIVVAAAAAARMLSPHTFAANRSSNAMNATSGAKISATMPITASILARKIRLVAIGAVETRSGASSPEMVSHANPPAS